jgi:hypothetical protein
VIVQCCKECPFFQETLLTFLASMLATRDRPCGVCGYARDDDSYVHFDREIESGSDRTEVMRRARDRMPVLNSREIPPGCPLRTQDITLTLAKN